MVLHSVPGLAWQPDTIIKSIMLLETTYVCALQSNETPVATAHLLLRHFIWTALYGPNTPRFGFLAQSDDSPGLHLVQATTDWRSWKRVSLWHWRS